MTIAEYLPVDGIEEAIALGPNGADVTSKVPFAMTKPHEVPAERYYSREFYELEKKHLWPKVWQMAAREEELPHPGDFVEYEIVGQSILIVRQPDMSVKALHNACRHRATELASGCGRFPGNQIVCPFHGWRWKTDGQISHVFGREGFSDEAVDPLNINLREAQCETWGGHVWINLDLEAPSLIESLFPAANILERQGVQRMKAKWWKESIINCNWKLAQEAFFEGWHVKQTHPQLWTYKEVDGEEEINKQNVAYTPFLNGHGRFQSGDARSSYGGKPDFLHSARMNWSGQDAMTLERDVTIFESVAGELDTSTPEYTMKAIGALYEFYKGAGIPAPPFTPEVMKLWGGDIHLFPNYLMLPMYANSLAYRIRPYNDDPDWCRFEVWSLTTYPEGEDRGRLTLTGRYDKDDDDHWGLIPRQDFANLERMQRGIKNQSLGHTTLAEQWEITISNMHQELDRRLAAEL
ncbi:phenylpropionate dioxygenase-like ring-hydroxylating dioxygenase large terminal subunit [Microbacterium terrae]|uniref:3-phenylpropionate/cinnamic acid dioxygenase subunit alpha n=1 Tax=Microbacterium terrae TaxID=69369 RepID=A0A0M2HI67_9MICO|nr:aromatic ring-hydroxylating dioxygenase subunit alpha [Microbacterium terrae]KJL44013.1 3-phenylpropionate/cinnamic acid dioxygenase subunit alpha [Microbacterium terrae]MBP1079453.1 phenylpropionate dioxygenase-like ring-hydroxylating dioxygenase large terminal subunit [Microbacterium terrae]GLJ98854.1 (2Fe-2S)-binding protein [Microbacterium terrae]